jgi:acyl-CoA thioester hydrolase
MSKAPPPSRSDFRHFLSVPTRWMDNDQYGHVNNVVYYSYFDTVVNQFLISRSVLDVEHGAAIGLVVETGCRFFRPVSFPDTLQAALRVDHLGTSSVRYAIGIFTEDDDEAAAQGHFVHVYVDRATRRPVPLPDALRTVLEGIR